MLNEFKHQPLTDFSIPENKVAFEAALKSVDSEKGKKYPIIIDGEKIYTADKVISINPSNYNEVIGEAAKGNEGLADKAINAAEKAFETWKDLSFKERANYLFNVAAIMKRRKHEFSALLVEEVGKTWTEADADTSEAIDFLEFYGRQALKLDGGMKLTPYNGIQNEGVYIPLGVGVIIAPWNFPLAILVGMTSAALVSGNTVVIKPASTAPIIAAKFMETLEEVGLPKGVANYLPCPGGTCGNHLVAHPKTRFINFTGSKEVGLNINKLAAEIVPGQKWIKRVSAEMGGKNGIIVDSDSDLDAAAGAIVAGAFGYQGQKCSACSRAIIVEDVYDEISKKVIEKTKKLVVGPGRKYETNVAAVIDKSAYDKVFSYIEIGKKEGKLLIGGTKCGDNGYFIAPTVFGDIDQNARIAQEEIFGPVLSLIKAKDFDDALKIANSTVYGLTGAVFANNRMKIERAKKEFHVGNLYINKGCTGALVGIEPFGGFNMSGTDSKAGGTDYLLLFTQAKSVSEKL